MRLRALMVGVATVALATLLVMAGEAKAQSTTSTASGAGTSTTNIINFSMTVEEAITLSITGGSDGGATTTLSGVSGNEGTVAFGTVNTLNTTLANGERFRTTDVRGSTFVATLGADILVSGGGTASLGLEREVAAGGGGDVALAYLRYASGT